MDPEKTRLEIAAEGQVPTAAKLDKDFRPLAFSENGEVEGDVVFAGYGLWCRTKEARATIATRVST